VEFFKKNLTLTGSKNNMYNSGKVLNRRFNAASKENNEHVFLR
jgi:hypothetical protein